jgi:hypothetical protein
VAIKSGQLIIQYAAQMVERLLEGWISMHLLICCTVVLAFAIFLDRSRVKASGLLFVLKDYVRQVHDRAILKRIIYTIGILLFVLALWQLLGVDWAFISIGADVILYLELLSAVYLVAARGHIQQTTRLAVRASAGVIQRSMASLRSRRRDRRSPRHNASSGDSSDGDAEPAVFEAFAFS